MRHLAKIVWSKFSTTLARLSKEMVSPYLLFVQSSSGMTGLHPNKTGSKLLGALISKCLYKALKSGKPDNQVQPEVVLERSDGASYSKKQVFSDIHQPKGTHPRMIVRDTHTPPPQMDDLDHFPCLTKISQPHEAGGKRERGVSGTVGVLTGYNEAVKRVVIKNTTPPPKVREKRTCKCMFY